MSEIAVSGIQYQMQPPRVEEKSTISVADKRPAHVDLSEGALEFKLIAISAAFTKSLERMIAVRVEEQKTTVARLNSFNELLHALQKLQGTDFSRADLDKVQDLPLSQAESRRVRAYSKTEAELRRDEAKKSAYDAEKQACSEFHTRQWNNSKQYRDWYTRQMASFVKPDGWSAGANGELYVYGYLQDGSRPSAYYQWRGKGSDSLRAAYWARNDAVAKAESDYQAAMTDEITLGKLLRGFGVCAHGEKLPATKDELKIAMTKLSDMVSSLQTTETAQVADTNGLVNNRSQELAKNSDRITGYKDAMRKLIDALR